MKNTLFNRFLLLLDNAPSHPLSMYDKADNKVFLLATQHSIDSAYGSGVHCNFQGILSAMYPKTNDWSFRWPQQTCYQKVLIVIQLSMMIHNIDSALKEVKRTINKCWGKVYKECVYDFDGSWMKKKPERSLLISHTQLNWKMLNILSTCLSPHKHHLATKISWNWTRRNFSVKKN